MTAGSPRLQNYGTGYDPLVTLERRNDGHRECVKVFVTLEKAVPSPSRKTSRGPDRAAAELLRVMPALSWCRHMRIRHRCLRASVF